MKDYHLNTAFRHDGQLFRVYPAFNLNNPCDGCHFRRSLKEVCNAPDDLRCSYPSRIFRLVETRHGASHKQKRKNTIWRRVKARLLWSKHFYNSDTSIHFYNSKI